jgi:hypothetical protein
MSKALRISATDTQARCVTLFLDISNGVRIPRKSSCWRLMQNMHGHWAMDAT